MCIQVESMGNTVVRPLSLVFCLLRLTERENCEPHKFGKGGTDLLLLSNIGRSGYELYWLLFSTDIHMTHSTSVG